ncbi:hypothetical protein THRCLA_21216, partial [Thraustotheca clavata]
DWIVEDVANVDLLSDLFTVFENEQVDADAQIVDEVNQLFTELAESETNDAQVVDEISELFASLEGEQNDAEVIEDLAAYLERDALAVDEVSNMFDLLEEDFAESNTKDESDAFNVDDVSDLFTCLATPSPVRQNTIDPRLPQVNMSSLDSRIPILAPRQLPKLGGFDGFVCGPPVFQRTQLTREDRVKRWKEKRKNRCSKDKPVFESRQQVAAKRRRINGRFAGLETQFISISTLQTCETNIALGQASIMFKDLKFIKEINNSRSAITEYKGEYHANLVVIKKIFKDYIALRQANLTPEIQLLSTLRHSNFVVFIGASLNFHDNL